MSDDIFIKQDQLQQAQQPFIARVSLNNQESVSAQQPSPAIRQTQQPSTYVGQTTYQHQQPTNNQESTNRNAQQPNSGRSKQSPFIYNHRAPSTYQHQSPSTYQHQSPSTYSNRQPSITQVTYQNRQPNIYQHQSPSIYQVSYQHRAPSITQSREPNTYVHRTPFTYDERQPNIYQHQSPSITVTQSPFTYDHRSPLIYTYRSPSIYQHQQPFTYDNREPTASNAQESSTYDHRSPSTYDHRSPLIYQHQSPSTYDHRSPIIYQHQSPSQTPSIYQHQSPSIYQHRSPFQSPFIYQHQSPISYNHRSPFQSPSTYQVQSPNTYNHRSPFISNVQTTTSSRTPFIFSELQPQDYITRTGPFVRVSNFLEVEDDSSKRPHIIVAMQESGSSPGDIDIYVKIGQSSGTNDSTGLLTESNTGGTQNGETIGLFQAAGFVKIYQIKDAGTGYSVARTAGTVIDGNDEGTSAGTIPFSATNSSHTDVNTDIYPTTGAAYSFFQTHTAFSGDEKNFEASHTWTFVASGQTTHTFTLICELTYTNNEGEEDDDNECPWCCVHESMLVATEEDMKSIHDIKIGDSVVSHNFETGENELVEVENIIIVERDVDYKVNDLILTEDHPVYLQDNSKVSVSPDATLRNYKQEVGQIELGQVMVRLDGTTEEITSIERYEGTHKNYAIKTKHNNFYADGILVDSVILEKR